MKTAIEIFNRIPDLLAQAREEVGPGGDIYPRQDALRANAEERRNVYRYSMPMRHALQCSICGRKLTEVHHELGAGSRVVRLDELVVHRVREHGDAFPADVEAFLHSVADHV